MRVLLVIFLAFLVAVQASRLPDQMLDTNLRSQGPRLAQKHVQGTKTMPPAYRLQKGEYVCGDRVCRLRPGEVPPNCNGVCQYKLNL